MIVWISVESGVISPLSFFIAPIWLFSLFFLINLASGLSILLIFSKKPDLGFIDILKGFSYLYLFKFSSDLSYFLSSAGFWVFWSCSSSSFNFDDRVSILDLSILLTYCYIFSSRDCFKCVPEILACRVFVLIGFEELLYFCLHFIVYPVNIQEPVVQFPWSCAVLS